LTDAGPEQDREHRGYFLPFQVHTEPMTRRFISVLLSWVFGSYPYSPTHRIGRKQKTNKKQEIDSEEEGRIFTLL